jgi:hypothetical protein
LFSYVSASVVGHFREFVGFSMCAASMSTHRKPHEVPEDGQEQRSKNVEAIIKK